MNNKIRYKSMKRSSPVTQYKRYLLGKHYAYDFRTRHISPMPIPKTIRDMIVENMKNYASGWARVESKTINRSRNILERKLYEESI